MQPGGRDSSFGAPWGNVNLNSTGNPNGQPVFLAHGRQDCAATFRQLMHFLPGKNFYYVAIDLPGSNTSEPLPIGPQGPPPHPVYDAIPDKANDYLTSIIDPTIPLPLKRGFHIVNVVTNVWGKVLFYDTRLKGYWIILTAKPNDVDGRQRFRLAPAIEEQRICKEFFLFQDSPEPPNLAEGPTSTQQDNQEPIRCNDHGDRRCPFATRVPAFAVPPEGAVTPLPEHLAKTPVVTKITPEDVTKIQSSNRYCKMPSPRLSMPTPNAHIAPDQPLLIAVDSRRRPVIPRAQLRKAARERYVIRKGHQFTQTSPRSNNHTACFTRTPWGSVPLCDHLPAGIMEWMHAYFYSVRNGLGYIDPDEYFSEFAATHLPQFIHLPPGMMQYGQYQPPPPYNVAYPDMIHTWPIPGTVPVYATVPTPRAYSCDPEYRETPATPLISRPQSYIPDHPSAFAYNARFQQNQATPPPRRPHTTQPTTSRGQAQFYPSRPSTANSTFRPQVAAFVRQGEQLVPFTVNQVTYTDDGIPILPDWSEKLGKAPRSPTQPHQMCDVEPFLYGDGCRHKTVSGEGCPFDPEKRKKSKEQEVPNVAAALEAFNFFFDEDFVQPPPSIEAPLEEKMAYFDAMTIKCVKIMRFHFLGAMEMAIEHLGWDKFIFIGHSMGCELGLFFNAIHPGRITKMIFLDAEPTLRRLQVVDLAEYQPKFYDGYYDNYEKDNHFFRTYTIPEATKALMRSRNLNEEAATTIIEKSLIHVKNDQYRFTWDRRLKLPAPQNYPNSYYFALFKNVPPTLLISASESLNAKTKYSPGSLELIRMMTGLENFKQVIVEGDHDVHLSHPERVAPYVVEFLTKNVVLPSKL